MTISMIDAAYSILRDYGVAKHYSEIINIALEHGLINTQGLTPGASLVSAISRENSKRIGRGESPRFEQMGDGVYGLVEWRPVGIERRIQDINKTTRQNLYQRISTMPPSSFEDMVGELLIAIGFDENTVQVTGRSGDGGIDVIGVMDIENITRIDVAVQVKRVSRNIPPDKIRALRGSLMPNQRGIFITTSDFTEPALHEASAVGKSPISTVNRNQLLDLLFKHNIGVASQQHTVYEIDSDYWPEAPAGVAPVVSAVTQKVVRQVPVNYPLPIFARYREVRYEALLLDTGEVLLGEQTFTSVSAAGIAVTGWKSCNGWRFWMFTNSSDGQEYLLDVLRVKDTV